MRRLVRTPSDDSPVREAVRRWLSGRPGLRRIAAYAPLSGEIDLLPLLTDFADRTWYFPRIDGEHLALHRVTDLADFIPGPWGIREPAPALPEIEPGNIDVFLCPGLAFDANGGRLGRGRGFYDRLLSKARPDAIKLGVCRPEQLVPDTFSEPHDIAMDEILNSEL